jgi:hypothetical protein
MPRSLSPVLTAIACALLAGDLGAQGTNARACNPTLVPAGSFSADTLFLAIDPGYGIKPVDSAAALTALSVVGNALTLPEPLTLPPAIMTTYSTESDDGAQMLSSGAQGFMGEAFVEIQRNGNIKRIGLSQTTLVTANDAALLDAVQKAADADAFKAYREAARGRGGFVFVLLRTIPLPSFKAKAEDYKTREALALVPAPYAAPGLRKKGDRVSMPIRALRIPAVKLESALSISKRGPDPAFPFDDYRERKDGFVNVEFVVGPDSAIVDGTLRLADALTAAYANAVIEALKEYRFSPAMAGGCPIAARMTYTFTFR